MKHLNYYKLEQRDSFDMKKTRTVYRIKNRGLVSGEQFIKEVEHRSNLNASLINAVLMEVKDELEELLGQGYAVTLPGIGAFSLGVRLNDRRKLQLEIENAAAEEADQQGKKAKSVAVADLSARQRRIIGPNRAAGRPRPGIFCHSERSRGIP
jgi:nucleoid DNA-binding protein